MLISVLCRAALCFAGTGKGTSVLEMVTTFEQATGAQTAARAGGTCRTACCITRRCARCHSHMLRYSLLLVLHERLCLQAQSMRIHPFVFVNPTCLLKKPVCCCCCCCRCQGAVQGC